MLVTVVLSVASILFRMKDFAKVSLISVVLCIEALSHWSFEVKQLDGLGRTIQVTGIL